MSDFNDELTARAYLEYQAGHRDTARQLCLQVLQQDSKRGPAIYLLAVIAQDLGRIDEATQRLRAAIEIESDNPVFWNALGELLLGSASKEEALHCFQESVKVGPTYERAHNNLGRVFHSNGDFNAATNHFTEALRLNPRYATAHNNLGATLLSRGDLQGAAEHFHQALRLEPTYPEAQFNLGSTLHARGDALKAIGYLREAVRLRPDYSRARALLAQSLIDLGQVVAALEHLKAVVELEPKNCAARRRLAAILMLLGQTDEAMVEFAEGIRLDPQDAECFALRFHLKEQLCDWSDRPQALQRLWSDASHAAEHGAMTPIHPLHAASLPWTVEQQLTISRSFARSFLQRATDGGAVKQVPATGQTSRLKIGYLSRDFYDHPVGHQIAGLFTLHDRERFEIHVYSFGPNDRSEYRRRIESGAENFHDIEGVATEELVNRMRSQGIQILVDLMGYTGMARTSVVASRPAPIQVNWLGFANTMGADFIDYTIGDHVVTPTHLAHGYSEQIARMPHSFMITDHHQPIASGSFERAQSGLPEGAVVFCAFHNAYKIDPDSFDAWMAILREVPDSVLWLSVRNPTGQGNLRREAIARGVPASRLIFADRVTSKAEHLARLRLADLFLDTRYYNAHASACDALWAGLPLLTCPGQTFASRVGASLLTAVGMPQLIASDQQTYCDLAMDVGHSPTKRTQLREELRDKRLTSPLFDTPLFVRDLETTFLEMWNAL